MHASLTNSFTPERTMESFEAVLTFESVDEMRWCHHSNETSSAVLSHGTIYLVCSSNFCDHSNEGSLLGSALTLYYLFLPI